MCNYYEDEFAVRFQMSRATAELLDKRSVANRENTNGEPFQRRKDNFQTTKSVASLVILSSTAQNGGEKFSPNIRCFLSMQQQKWKFCASETVISVPTKKFRYLRGSSACCRKFPVDPDMPSAIQPVKPKIFVKWNFSHACFPYFGVLTWPEIGSRYLPKVSSSSCP